jgi:hypothetical protein
MTGLKDDRDPRTLSRPEHRTAERFVVVILALFLVACDRIVQVRRYGSRFAWGTYHWRKDSRDEHGSV